MRGEYGSQVIIPMSSHANIINKLTFF